MPSQSRSKKQNANALAVAVDALTLTARLLAKHLGMLFVDSPEMECKEHLWLLLMPRGLLMHVGQSECIFDCLFKRLPARVRVALNPAAL